MKNVNIDFNTIRREAGKLGFELLDFKSAEAEKECLFIFRASYYELPDAAFRKEPLKIKLWQHKNKLRASYQDQFTDPSALEFAQPLCDIVLDNARIFDEEESLEDVAKEAKEPDLSLNFDREDLKLLLSAFRGMRDSWELKRKNMQGQLDHMESEIQENLKCIEFTRMDVAYFGGRIRGINFAIDQLASLLEENNQQDKNND